MVKKRKYMLISAMWVTKLCDSTGGKSNFSENSRWLALMNDKGMYVKWGGFDVFDLNCFIVTGRWFSSSDKDS